MNSSPAKRRRIAAEVCVAAADADVAASPEAWRQLFELGYVCVPIAAKRATDSAAVELHSAATREAIQLFLDWRFESTPPVPSLDAPESFRAIFRPPHQARDAAFCPRLAPGGRSKTVIGYSSGQLQLFHLHRILARYLVAKTTLGHVIAGGYRVAHRLAYAAKRRADGALPLQRDGARSGARDVVELDIDVDSFAVLTAEQAHLSVHVDVDLFAPAGDENIFDRIQCVVGVMCPEDAGTGSDAGDGAGGGAVGSAASTHAGPHGTGTTIVLPGVHRYGALLRFFLGGAIPQLRLVARRVPDGAGRGGGAAASAPAPAAAATTGDGRGGGAAASAPASAAAATTGDGGTAFVRGASFTALPPSKFNARAFEVFVRACYAQQRAYGVVVSRAGEPERVVCPAMRIDSTAVPRRGLSHSGRHGGAATSSAGGASAEPGGPSEGVLYGRSAGRTQIRLARDPFSAARATRAGARPNVAVASILDAAQVFCAAPRARVVPPRAGHFVWTSVGVPPGHALLWMGLPHANTANRSATARVAQIVSLYDRESRARR